jgi:hypothetical protein
LNIQSIVTQLKDELTRIGEVIGLLEGGAAPGKRRIGRPPGSATGKARGRRPGTSLTPAGRRKLSQAMKLRWAQRRGAAGTSVAAKPKKRGGITAAGRKKLSEAMKKRWADKKRKGS